MAKICIKCGQEKPFEAFAKHPRTKDGRGGVCKLCINIRRKERGRSEKEKATARRYMKSKRGKENRKRAVQNYQKKYPLKLKLTERNNRLRREYNITSLQYNEILMKQNGRCAICGGINKTGRQLAVDHNHKTSKIRGLLCNNCNSVLGWAKDSIFILANAIEYINKSEMEAGKQLLGLPQDL